MVPGLIAHAWHKGPHQMKGSFEVEIESVVPTLFANVQQWFQQFGVADPADHVDQHIDRSEGPECFDKLLDFVADDHARAVDNSYLVRECRSQMVGRCL